MKLSFLFCLLPAVCGWSLSTPRKVLYIDSGFDYNDPGSSVISACNAGYNVVYLAFYISTGSFDMAASWQGMTQASQQAAISACHAKNAAVMVSYGGATETPYTKDANAIGQTVGNWILANNLDGVDFDLENFGPGMTYNTMDGQHVVAWLANVTTAVRAVLGTTNKFISHAPQAPYFGLYGSASMWPGTSGGYTGVYRSAGSAIDWFNVQFYNQGGSCYTTEAGIFTSSASDCTDFPGTSVAEIVSYGIPASKIVVGKYSPSTEGSNGYVDPSALAPWLSAHANGGVMLWQWKSLTQVTAWSSVFGGTSAPTVSPAPTQAPAPTHAPSSAAPSATAAPAAPSTRAPSASTGGVGVSACVSVGQSSLCTSYQCAGSCRGFTPYYTAGCIQDSTCSSPPNGAKDSLCDCKTSAPSTAGSVPTAISGAPSSPTSGVSSPTSVGQTSAPTKVNSTTPPPPVVLDASAAAPVACLALAMCPFILLIL